MLAPYARPRVKVVGGDDSVLPMWKAVSAERSAVASGAGAMPAGRDYIAAYLEQAPGYANLITPFAEMPTELLMPYSARGYGVPRPAAPGRCPGSRTDRERWRRWEVPGSGEGGPRSDARCCILTD